MSSVYWITKNDHKKREKIDKVQKIESSDNNAIKVRIITKP